MEKAAFHKKKTLCHQQNGLKLKEEINKKYWSRAVYGAET